jgi:hypothetical protein
MKKLDTDRIKIARIRPVAWKIFVQGREGADYARDVLRGMSMLATEPEQVPGLTDPPLWSFDISSDIETPIMAEELAAMLRQDPRIECDF